MELGSSPVFSERVITQPFELLLDAAGHPGYDNVTNAFVVERFDKLVVEEARIGSDSNPVQIRRYLLEALSQELWAACCSIGIPWSQDPMPVVLGVKLEAEQGMVRTGTPPARIVPYFGLLDLLAVDSKNGGIEVEKEVGPRSREVEHLEPEAIVNFFDLLNSFRADPFQETPQTGGIGEALQPDNPLKGPVALENLGSLQPMNASDQSINDGQDKFYWMILTRALGKGNSLLKMPLQPQLFAKPVNQDDSAKVGKVPVPDGNSDFSQSSGHPAQSSPLGMVLPNDVSRPNYTQIPSELQLFS